MKTFQAILFMCVVSAFISCRGRDGDGATDVSNLKGDKNNTDSTRGFPEANSIPAQQTQAADQETVNFVTKAASGGMLEVQLGQIATQKANSERVKNFGQMMVADHSRANDELKGLAASQNISIPTALLPEHQKHLDMMSKMTGAEFDRHYMEMMLNDHKEDINEFKKEAGNNKADAFSAFASKALPVLQKHLDSAQAISGKIK